MNRHAATLENSRAAAFFSTPLSQPHAPANTEDDVGSLHQSAGDQNARMPAIPTRFLMATPHHMVTMHLGKPQVGNAN